MNITNKELKQLKRLLTAKDLEYIALSTQKTKSTVNAVFYTRPNDEIERKILKTCENKLVEFQELINKINLKNNRTDESNTKETL